MYDMVVKWYNSQLSFYWFCTCICAYTYHFGWGNMCKRTVLVTGATGGIGREIASFLVEKNYSVIVHGRDEARVEELCRCIDLAGAYARPITGNLNTEGSRAEFVSKLTNTYGVVDVLINNAGGGGAHEDWWETTEKKWLEI